jgi:hypothetical protein
LFGSFGRPLRALFPFINTSPPLGASGMQEPELDPGITDRVWRSFHNRLGRAPTEQELGQALPHFLPGGMPMAPAGRPHVVTQFAAQQYGPEYGSDIGGPPERAGDSFGQGGGFGDQVAAAISLRSVRIIEPQRTGELLIKLGKDDYRAWVRVTNLGSWYNPLVPYDRRSPLTGGSPHQVDVEFDGDVQSADRMRASPIALRISNNLPVGQAAVEWINGGAAIRGPGQIWLQVTNRGPHPVATALGAD